MSESQFAEILVICKHKPLLDLRAAEWWRRPHLAVDFFTDKGSCLREIHAASLAKNQRRGLEGGALLSVFSERRTVRPDGPSALESPREHCRMGIHTPTEKEAFDALYQSALAAI